MAARAALRVRDRHLHPERAAPATDTRCRLPPSLESSASTKPRRPPRADLQRRSSGRHPDRRRSADRVGPSSRAAQLDGTRPRHNSRGQPGRAEPPRRPSVAGHRVSKRISGDCWASSSTAGLIKPLAGVSGGALEAMVVTRVSGRAGPAARWGFGTRATSSTQGASRRPHRTRATRRWQGGRPSVRAL